MTGFFQGFFRMALGASVVALVILAVRPILKKYSNRIACLLWAVLLFRLLCPYVIESPAPAFFARWEQQMEASQTGGDAGFDVEGSPKHVTPLDELAKAPKQAQDPRDIARIDDQTTVSESTWDVAGKPSASEEGLTKTEETKAGAENLTKTEKTTTGTEDLTKIEGKTEVEEGLTKTEGKTEAGQAETWFDPGYETDETKAQASKGETKGGQEQDVAQDSQTEDLGKLWQQENLQADETTEKLQADGATADKLQDDGWQTDGMLADEGQMGELQTGEASLKAGAQTEEDALQAGTQASLVDRIGMGFVKIKKAVSAWFASVQGRSLTNVFGVVWLFGAFAFLILGARKYMLIRGKLLEAIPCGKWEKYPVKISDAQGVPMSFGVIRPGIFVPASFEKFGGVQDQASGAKPLAQDQAVAAKVHAQECTSGMNSDAQELILWHEATHLKHKDPLWKLVSFLALAVHWWNPLVWLCIRCMNQDMEMACDESVLRQVGAEKKEAYAKTILDFATAHSGISLAAAFGESHAESRIKNALRYRKAPVWLSVILLVFVVLLGGCLATNPSAKGEEEQEPEGILSQSKEKESQEEYLSYDSEEAYMSDQEQRFADRLRKKGILSESDEIFTVYSVVRKPYSWHDEDVHYPYEIYLTTFSEDGELRYFYSVLDYYKKTLDGDKAPHYFIGKGKDEEIGAVTDVATAYKVYPYFYEYAFDYQGSKEGVPVFDNWSGKSGAQYLADILGKTAPEKAEGLKDPVTATAFWLSIQGGQGKFIEKSFVEGYVEWQFDNGEQIHYDIYEMGGLWLPVLNMEWYDALEKDWYPQVTTETTERDWDGLKRTKEFLEGVTAKDLRSVKEKIKYGEGASEREQDEKFGILFDLPEKDVTLYGVYDEYAMMLRVGDQAYPLKNPYITYKRDCFKFACGDYDGDGQDEYALINVGTTGSETPDEELYVIEIRPNGAVVNHFTTKDRFGYLEKVLAYSYDEKEQVLNVSIKGGHTVLRYLRDELPADAKVSGMIYGYSESVTPVDDELFYRCSGHLRTTDGGWLGMSIRVDLLCRVQYHDDGTFAMETPSFTDLSSPYGGVRNKDSYGYYLGEEVICVRKADLTRDGVDDYIVTSVPYLPNTKDFPWEKRLEQGDVCSVCVYDGTDPEISDNEFPTQNAIWGKSFRDAYAGNEYVFLCEKNGRSYLLSGCHEVDTGEERLMFVVEALGPNGRYEMDKDEIFVQFRVPEEQWSVDEMFEHTEKLHDWIGDAKLIAFFGADGSTRIPAFDQNSVGDFSQRKIQEKTYGAWEIWDELNRIMERDISISKRQSTSILKIDTVEDVHFTGMDGIRGELEKLNRNWRRLADWQKKHSYLSRIEVDLQDGRNVVTCDLTHDGIQETITVEYADVEKDSQALLLLDVRNAQKEFMWEGTLGRPYMGWGKYYVTLYEGLLYLLFEFPMHDRQGEEIGSFKVFCLDNKGNEVVLEERTYASSTAKDPEKEKTEFEEALKKYKSVRATLLAGIWEGELLVNRKPSNW